MSETKNFEGIMSYRYMRYYAFFALTVLTLTVPWITIDGNHFFLLSFDHKQLHLGFVAFDMQELYLMPFLLIMLFLGIFWITVVGGRMFCGWMCPQTIFRVVYRDLIETKLLKMRRSIENKQKEIDYSKTENKVKKVIAILIWTLLAFLAASNFMWYFVPPEEFFVYIQNPSEHYILAGFIGAVTLFLVYDVVKLKEDFCVYVCPYSRVQSVMYEDDTLIAIYDEYRGGTIYNENHEKLVEKQKQLPENAECTTCEKCVTVCPTHIDIRKGMQLECINCLECVDACTTVMGNLGKESLVRWSSTREVEKREGKTRIIRFKTVGYLAIIAVVFAFMVKTSGEKEHMLLNINKETRLYSVEKQGDEQFRVKNNYIFLFQNTEKEDHTYYFEITNNDDIKILRPKKAFTLEAGKKEKKIVTLYTDKRLADDERKDTPIHLTIKAYAVDAKEHVSVFREAIFVYPKKDKLK
jgi:cytochrome c oxidase accessory protein FixG